MKQSTKEKLEIEKEALQQELDELKVHLALGRADAISYLEERKSDFSSFIEEMKHDVSNFESPASEATRKLKAKLDHLKVQLALGRMESHDTYCAQRSKIADAIDEIEGELGARAQEGKEGFADLRASFGERARTFRVKLESAGLTLGAGALLAAHEVEDTVEKTNNWLNNLADMTLEEIQEARKYVKKRVATHSKKNEHV